MAASITRNAAMRFSALKKYTCAVSASGIKALTCPMHRTACMSHRRFLQLSKLKWQEAAASSLFTTPVVEAESQVDQTLQQEDYFNLKELVTLQKLFQARVHLGHNTGLRHETMIPYIYGERLGADIIDLDQTLTLLRHTLNVCAHIVYRGGMVLFLTRNMQILPWVERMAREVGEYSHCRAWKRGTFTNAATTFGTLPIYPELCVFFSTQDTVFGMHRGILESNKLLIPSIGIADTNCDVSHLSYVVPGNDDTPDALHLYIDLFREAVMRAKQKRKEDGLEEGKDRVEGT